MIQRSLFGFSFGPTLGLTLTLAVSAGAACGGQRAPAEAQPAAAPEAMTAFMRAVADSNLNKMAELWGSSKGPAATTRQPSDFERRLVVIQSYLRHDDYRVASNVLENKGHRSMQVELRRQACTWIVPFSLVKVQGDQWIVNSVDLTRAGNPAQPCDPDAATDTTRTENPSND